jgi:predicted phage-related endonuclease
MKIQKFNNEEEWLLARRGKITGTRLKDLIVKRGTNKKIGYYELIAERISIPDDYENPMERGKMLEYEAIKTFEEQTGKEVNTDLVIWERDDNQSIAISPDGYIGETEAVEVKCLGSAYHVKAILTNEIPSDYEEQVLQYFIVNDKLETLHFVMYDPRIPAKSYIRFEATRESLKEKIEEYLKLEEETLKEIDEIVLSLSGF